MIERLLNRAANRAAARHPVNTGPASHASWPHARRWQRLAAPFIGHVCPDCGVAPLTRHREGCLTGTWDGGTWA